MERFKFRAWDSENDCWRYGFYTRLQEGARKYNAIVCDEDGTLVRYYIHKESTIGQYTGLKDKNGKKQHGGDRCVDMNGDTYTVVVDLPVIYKEYNNCFEALTKDDNGMFEIIENIHERPELAK